MTLPCEGGTIKYVPSSGITGHDLTDVVEE